MKTPASIAAGLAIKARRADILGSQEDMASRTGLSQSLISQIERGVQNATGLSVERFFSLLNALQWSPADFTAATGLTIPGAERFTAPSTSQIIYLPGTDGLSPTAEPHPTAKAPGSRAVRVTPALAVSAALDLRVPTGAVLTITPTPPQGDQVALTQLPGRFALTLWPVQPGDTVHTRTAIPRTLTLTPADITQAWTVTHIEWSPS